MVKIWYFSCSFIFLLRLCNFEKNAFIIVISAFFELYCLSLFYVFLINYHINDSLFLCSDLVFFPVIHLSSFLVQSWERKKSCFFIFISSFLFEFYGLMLLYVFLLFIFLLLCLLFMYFSIFYNANIDWEFVKKWYLMSLSSFFFKLYGLLFFCRFVFF